jgi:hypothetical protein
VFFIWENRTPELMRIRRRACEAVPRQIFCDDKKFSLGRISLGPQKIYPKWGKFFIYLIYFQSFLICLLSHQILYVNQKGY